MKLQPDDRPRSSLSIGSRFRRCNGISSKFSRRFVERIGKLTRNMPGDRLKKTRRLTARMPEATGLAESRRDLSGLGCASPDAPAQICVSGCSCSKSPMGVMTRVDELIILIATVWPDHWTKCLSRELTVVHSSTLIRGVTVGSCTKA
ncbi:hypothetical protein B296_00036189 [Ensete ventricosum]|uniref:Uncharacterized protein n=1 Tax=Ensete ventricosum TaxID=4639 RepID=A0A426ZGG3_ENSVE|nr:hypothetical protein B296_00036189 [Ensete ventricosum]